MLPPSFLGTSVTGRYYPLLMAVVSSVVSCSMVLVKGGESGELSLPGYEGRYPSSLTSPPFVRAACAVCRSHFMTSYRQCIRPARWFVSLVQQQVAVPRGICSCMRLGRPVAMSFDAVRASTPLSISFCIGTFTGCFYPLFYGGSL